MHHVYILISKTTSKYYTGHTVDLVNRLREHNSGETPSIWHGIPWEVVWTQICDSKGAAMKLESKIKKRGAGRFLNDINATS